jgi:hypothetical protein
VQLHHHPRTEHRVVLSPAHPLGQLPTRASPDGQLAVVERHKQRVQAWRGWLPAALAGRLDRALADGLGVACRHPSPWRMKALRSDGQVVPSSAAAAFTEPRLSASWKARSASPRSARKRLGCQPSGWRSCRRPYSAPHPGYERVLSEADVEQYAAIAWIRLRPAA